jgi:hypothetical protein
MPDNHRLGILQPRSHSQRGAIDTQIHSLDGREWKVKGVDA